MKLKYTHRLFILQAVFILLIILIWGQLFKLQVLKSEDLNSRAKKQFFKPTLQLRGDIRDRAGNLLALDIISYDLYNNVKDIKKLPEEKISILSGILKLSPETLIKKLSERRNTKILSGINEKQAREIENYRDIVYLVLKATRAYPNKKMASQIIGFVNNDRIGQHGVELYYNSLITKPSEYDNINSFYQKGTNLALTIDSVLQEYSEEELEKIVKSSKANKGTIIALSPASGEILAWAVYPGFDPNNFYREKSIKNWAVTDIYEPGSTFKAITIASALENMAIQKDSKFFDGGFLKVGKRTIKNHNKTKPQYLDLLELFKQSSNVASAQVGLKMKKEDFYNSIKKFMIGERTDIDLPGESKGLLLPVNNWRLIDQATTAFGQGAVSLTPIQLAGAIGIIANHGIWVQPHLLKGIWDLKYNIISNSPNQIDTKEVISIDTADFVSGLLKLNVKENLKAMAYLAGNVTGYEVAGKTGTAQKVRPDGMGYLPGHTVASFIGYLPADNPKILVLVIVDDPKTAGGWGNTVCGPVFNNVAKIAAKRFLKDLAQIKRSTNEKV